VRLQAGWGFVGADSGFNGLFSGQAGTSRGVPQMEMTAKRVASGPGVGHFAQGRGHAVRRPEAATGGRMDWQGAQMNEQGAGEQSGGTALIAIRTC